MTGKAWDWLTHTDYETETETLKRRAAWQFLTLMIILSMCMIVTIATAGPAY